MTKLLDIEPMNIIVKMPNWLGDAVMATPILKDLRARFPEAKLTALCQSNIAPLLAHDPHLTDLISYKKPSGWIHRAEHHDVINPLKLGGYDLALLLTNSFTSAWWFWRGRVPIRIGFATHFRSWLLTNPVPLPIDKEKQHLVKTYKALLEPLGVAISDNLPTLYLSENDRAFATQFMKNCGVHSGDYVIGINPGAAYGSAKCWPLERFKALTKKLMEIPNCTVLYFGDSAGAPLVQEICQGMPLRVINLAGKTSIRELMALTSACTVFLSNDSGPMHIASALNVPLVAIFGSTSAIKTGPYKGETVIHKHVECSPCYKRTCPIDFRCMMRISVDEVFQAITDKFPKKINP